jgi:hypothetical protein
LSNPAEADPDPPSAVEAVPELGGRDHSATWAGRATRPDPHRQRHPEGDDEGRRSLRSWTRAKLHGLNLGTYGTVTPADCHRAAYSMWPDAQRLIAAAGAVLAWAWLRTPQATSDPTHTGELEHAAA